MVGLRGAWRALRLLLVEQRGAGGGEGASGAAHVRFPGARVIGNVSVPPNFTAYNNSLLAALDESSSVRVGAGAVLSTQAVVVAQDGHVSIGRNAFIHHKAQVSGANVSLGDHSVVGAASVVRDSSLGDGAMLAPHSRLRGKSVKAGELWHGNPARYVRDVTDDDRRLAQAHLDDAHRCLELFRGEGGGGAGASSPFDDDDDAAAGLSLAERLTAPLPKSLPPEKPAAR